MLRILGALEKVLDQVSAAAAKAAAAAASSTSTLMATVAEEENGGKEEDDDTGDEKEVGDIIRRNHPKMLVAHSLGKENVKAAARACGSGVGGGGNLVAAGGYGMMNRSKTANNRRITLSDFYAGHGAEGVEDDGMSSSNLLGKSTIGSRGGVDVVSSVNDEHRTARLAMRQQEKVFAKAAKKKALRDKEAAAEAARVAAAAARIAANERFRVVEKEKKTKNGHNAKDEDEEGEEAEGYQPGQIVAGSFTHPTIKQPRLVFFMPRNQCLTV